MDDQSLAERIRAFNRLYTQAIGSLDDRHEGLDVSLAQSRMLFRIGWLAESQVNQIELTNTSTLFRRVRY